MEDHIFLEDFQHMARGRIPERVFHAKGSGVHGYFEVTHDISKYCAASVFQVGKRTPQFTRFSIGVSQLGSTDTLPRGIRGLSTKFYTEEGNWDLSCLSEPVLVVNDPGMLLNFSNARNNDPKANLPSPDRSWDIVTLLPESVHFMLLAHTDRGIPDGYRHMNAFAINTFKLINKHGEPVFARFHVLTDQGIRNLDPIRAVQLAGANPDYYVQDLVQAIERGDYPSYSVSIQVMTEEQAQDLEFNPFNVTKVWPHKRFPLIPVGKLVMNRNALNHWDETEQSIFFPGNFVPGIRAAPGDKNLAGRIMIYRDAQVYRLGVNHNQWPINRPTNPVQNYQREGRGVITSQAGAPNYFPNSFGGPIESIRAQELDPSFRMCADIGRYEERDPDHYSQPRELWRSVLDEEHKRRTVGNLAASLRPVVRKDIQRRAIELFRKVDEELGSMIEEALDRSE